MSEATINNLHHAGWAADEAVALLTTKELSSVVNNLTENSMTQPNKPDLILVDRKVFLDLIAAAEMARAWLALRSPGGDNFALNARKALNEALPPAIANDSKVWWETESLHFDEISAKRSPTPNADR